MQLTVTLSKHSFSQLLWESLIGLWGQQNEEKEKRMSKEMEGGKKEDNSN